MFRKDLVIIGAGGFAREVQWLVEEINQEALQWNLIGFIDDDKAKKGHIINELPILGGFEWFEDNPGNVNVVFAVGNPMGRKKLADKFLKHFKADFPNLVHPTVRLSRYVEMGTGNILCASSLLTTNIKLGNFNILNLNCTIGHDVEIENFCTLSPAVNVSGNVTLCNGCELGTNSCVIQGITIGEWSVMGAGAVVIRDIDPRCTAVGVPAKVIKHQIEGGEPKWRI